MRRLRWTSGLGGAALLGVAALLTAQGLCVAGGKIPCKYDVEVLQNDCGLFPSFIQAGGIAEDGSIAGMFEACSPPNDRGFLWLPEGTFIPITLPVSPFLYQLAAVDVNDAHQVVGTYNAPLSFGGHTGFIYDQGRITALGTFPGGNYSDATAVNRFGVVTGFAGNLSGGIETHAFIFQDGVMFSLGPDLGTPSSHGYDISDDSRVTGYMGTSPEVDARAFIWDASKVAVLPALPGGISSVGLSITSLGNVAGWGVLDDGGAFGSIQRAYAYIDGEPIALGTLPDLNESRANAINDDNVIVGIGHQLLSPSAGFVWANNLMYNLNDLVDPKLGIIIYNAIGINTSGQISASGVWLGHAAVFRLHPPPIEQGDLTCDSHVDGADLQALLESWGACPIGCSADLDENGFVNGFDLAILLGYWG